MVNMCCLCTEDNESTDHFHIQLEMLSLYMVSLVPHCLFRNVLLSWHGDVGGTKG